MKNEDNMVSTPYVDWLSPMGKLNRIVLGLVFLCVIKQICFKAIPAV